MSDIVIFSNIEKKIICIRESFVLVDRDIAELYGVDTKRINEAVSNNPDKFPNDYMFELTNNEKKEVVDYFDHLSPIKYSPYLPKVFTKKGLWMLATILSGRKARETTFLIIETFDKIDHLKNNLVKLEQINEETIRDKLTRESGEILAEILEVPDKDSDTSTETSVEINFGVLKYKRTVKKIPKKDDKP